MTITNPRRSHDIVKEDIKNGLNFVRYPYEVELFESEREARLEKIKSDLEESRYVPQPCVIADVPKGKGAVRPGAILTIDDQIAYTLLLDSEYEKFRTELLPLQGVSDFAYQLQPNASSDKWYKHQFVCWDEFKDRSLDKLNQGFQFVVITDVTGCYENIDHNLLLADLRRIGVPSDKVTEIRKLLKKWSQVGTKGLPQGVSASHLLAKLYMSGVDIEMRNLGYEQIRFVDDIRVFCNSVSEAKKALMALTDILRKRGLNLQSAKSKILQVEEAKLEIVGKATVIDILHEKLRSEVDFVEVEGYPYAVEIQVNTGRPNAEQLDVIKQAFNDYFLSGNNNEFDKTLFHYLLNKLGNAGDELAISYCLDLLEKHPQETSYILKYFGKVSSRSIVYSQLVVFMNSTNAVYDYQNYLISQWLFNESYQSTDFLDFMRSVAFDNNKPAYYRAIAKQVLGVLGEHHDLTRIRDSFTQASSAQEKEAVLCSLNRLEVRTRDSFLRDTVVSEPHLVSAANYAKRTLAA